MPEFKVFQLWPTPIYEGKFDVKPEWVEYAKSVEYMPTELKNGYLSVDKYILNSTELSELKNIVHEHLNNYVRKFLNIRDNIDFKLLNSWFTKHRPGDWCQPHYHTNSLISGVLYLNVPQNSGNFVLQRMSSFNNLFPTTIGIEYNEPNYINDDIQDFDVKAGDILLFPSQIMHKIRENESQSDRYSLAFNFWPKGKLGIREFELEL